MTDALVRMSNIAQGAQAPGGVKLTTKGADMDAYDQLGPACRAALRAALIGPWSAETFLLQHRKRGWNPKDPTADAALAAEFAEIDSKAAIQTAPEGHPIRDTSNTKPA